MEASVEGEEVQQLDTEEDIGEEREEAEEDTRMHEDEESEEDSRWILSERQEQERMARSSARALQRPKAKEKMVYTGFGEPRREQEL